jgi:CxxC motif-containing protein (DUF1111 family)
MTEGFAMWQQRSTVSLGVKLGLLGLTIAMIHTIAGGLGASDSEPSQPDPVAVGYEIFNREWMPDDARARGGDGLGPVYNDTSCVVCHNAGGSGGSGPASKNIDILNAAPGSGPEPAPQDPRPSTKAALDALADFHSGFRLSRTVVLHRFGTDPNYEAWRRTAVPLDDGNVDVQDTEALIELEVENAVRQHQAENKRSPFDDGPRRVPQAIRSSLVASGSRRLGHMVTVGPFLVSRSERNPTALFGLGLIDAIPDAAIEAMANQQATESPETAGRVSRLKDGRIGRLGWKGQTAHVDDFVLNACAVEIGLEVPGHHQSIVPQAPKYQSPGLDLTSNECASLTAYVLSLPRPVERPASGVQEAKTLAAGKATFASVGCAVCHTPRLGTIDGIYSDLLLHDMGAQLGEVGSYSDGSDAGSDEEPVAGPDPRLAVKEPAQAGTPAAPRGATRVEWRTPPLWGCRDSGPYLHDGRAQSLEQAVALHGGQGTAAAKKFRELSPRERFQVEAFLKSLIAPPSAGLAQRAD